MKVLLTGATGQLGGYIIRELAAREVDLRAWSGTGTSCQLTGVAPRPVDLADADATARAFREARPDAVLHAAAVSSVAACHRDPARARLVNTAASALLADLAAGAGVRLVLVSTDLVFDGEKGWYAEDDPPAPLSAYGRTKAEAEREVLARPGCAVARLSLLFGPSLTDRPAFFDQQAQALRAGRPVTCFEDEWRTPLDLRTAAAALADLAGSDFVGLLHIGGPERMSRLEMGLRLADFLGADRGLVRAVSRDQAGAAEPRPRDTSLRSARWRALFPSRPWPAWHEALEAMGP
jgi:dTDP-4-dehydrorhamnose reductase